MDSQLWDIKIVNILNNSQEENLMQRFFQKRGKDQEIFSYSLIPCI